MGELIVRSAGLDYRLLRPLLYYQTANLDILAPSADARLGYALKPNSRADYKGSIFTVNSLGFRSLERPSRKRNGVIRILCLGGSNTFGASVNDGETYPAQLERVLNFDGANRFEVWNAGVNAYVLSQDVAAAQDDIELLDPDILLFMRTNKGRRAFLPGQDVKPYFCADPRRFLENLPYIPFAQTRWGLRLMAHSAIYRAVVIAFNLSVAHFNGDPGPQYDAERRINIPALYDFLKTVRGRRTVIMLSNPSSQEEEELSASALPWIDLGHMVPKSAGPEYREIHPPARVYRWYARTIAAALKPFLKAR